MKTIIHENIVQESVDIFTKCITNSQEIFHACTEENSGKPITHLSIPYERLRMMKELATIIEPLVRDQKEIFHLTKEKYFENLEQLMKNCPSMESENGKYLLTARHKVQ